MWAHIRVNKKFQLLKCQWIDLLLAHNLSHTAVFYVIELAHLTFSIKAQLALIFSLKAQPY